MTRSSINRSLAAALLAAVFALPGCAWFRPDYRDAATEMDLEHFKSVSTRIEYPDVEGCSEELLATTGKPITVGDYESAEFWDLTLEEAVQTALSNSKVLRDLGGLVLQSPAIVPTVFGPAAQETNPQFGVEAALSAFDAQWSTQAFVEKNDRAQNDQFRTGSSIFEQDLFDYSSQLTKRAATGSEFTVRHTMNYDFNNSRGNVFMNGAWNTNVEAEFRQPLLQGAGVQFNRTAGPGAVPGVYNGVLIARVNTDISLADFEIGVRNLIHDVETAYWELYFAYRDLDAKIDARNRAQVTWQNIRAAFETGRRGGEAENEARAREQYFRLEEEVQNALAGQLQERVRTITFRGTGGVYNNERRLRLLMGLPINDGRLIRPSHEPLMAKVVFDWDDIMFESLQRRAELRRQKWVIKQRELECLAARNFLYPRVDTVGRYRFRGFGHDLLNHAENKARFDNAVDDLLSGDFQEWQLGLEVSFPVGFRQAHAAVRHAQLNLTREFAVLEEQEREVLHDLSNAYAEIERAYAVAKTNYNRRLAAKEQLEALEALYEHADQNERTRRLVDLLLDAQRRLADAESGYFRSLVEYMLAIKLVHYSKGSLLEYNQVYLSEGAWPYKAYDDAETRDRLRMRAWRLNNFILSRPLQVSRGPYGPMGGAIDGGALPPDFEEHDSIEHELPPADGEQLYDEQARHQASAPHVAPVSYQEEDTKNFVPPAAPNEAVRQAALIQPVSGPNNWSPTEPAYQR